MHTTHNTPKRSDTTYDNEAIVRHAYHTAEGNLLDVAGFVGSFTDDGVFNDVVGQQSYRGEQLGEVVLRMGKLIPDVHRELHRVTVLGDVVAVELSIQGTFLGPLETPATGLLQPTGAKIDVPTADFWYLRDGEVETFNCYVGYSRMFAQMGLMPDFAPAVDQVGVSEAEKLGSQGHGVQEVAAELAERLAIRTLVDAYAQSAPIAATPTGRRRSLPRMPTSSSTWTGRAPSPRRSSMAARH